MLSNPSQHSGAALVVASSPASASAGGGGVNAVGAGGPLVAWLLSYRLSDLLFLLLGCAALLWTLRSSADYELRVAWTEEGRGGGWDMDSWKHSAALVTDVDGDGINEVVTVGEDQLSVRVLGRADGPGGSAPFSSSSSSSSPPSPASALQLSELWRVSVSASSSSPLSFLSGVVKLHAGYLDPYELHRNRAQVLVAVTAGGEVLCIDAAQRALLWRRRLTAGGGESGHGEADDTAEAGGEGQSATESGARLSSSEVSVLINPHPMRLNDSGVVVVGVRVRPSQHFSHFAFSGRSGQPRWRHDTNDFLSSQHSTRTAASNPSSSSSPSSMSSADVVLHEAHEVHSGEVEWRNYRSAFLSALPHQWLSPSDTSLQLAQVSPPQRQGQLGVKDAEAARASSSRRAAASLSASLPSASLLSVPAASALWAHDDAEHLAHPNALFAHTREGVELLSFYTGRPLAHLPLQPGQAHADLNADGVIDHLQILNGAAAKREGEGGGGEGGEDPAMPFAASAWLSAFSPCSAVVSSGVPPVSPLFNVSLCGGALERLLFRGLSAVSSRTMRRGRGNRGGPGGVGGIPWTQSMQGRRHLRLQPTAGGATAGPAGRRRPPRRRPPHPLASAATDDGASAELLSQREDDTQEGAAAAAAEGGGAEAGEEEQLEQAMDVGEEEDASEWVSAPLQLPAVRHSPAEGAASPAGLVSYFLSSHGLVTAVDGRGRKLFATHTAAALSAHSSADSAAATPHHRSSHHHILPYHVKRDEAQECLLLLGSSSVVVLDRADGRVLASATRLQQPTPAHPSATPQPRPPSPSSSAVFTSASFGDVDGDGYADVLVSSSDGSLSLFTFTTHVGAALFPQLLAALTLALTALAAAHIALAHSTHARHALHTVLAHAHVQRRTHDA